jgi:hypothetical protein
MHLLLIQFARWQAVEDAVTGVASGCVMSRASQPGLRSETLKPVDQRLASGHYTLLLNRAATIPAELQPCEISR